MNKHQVKELALANGFKLKEQPDGTLDLNPYVYQFAAALAAEAGRAGFVEGYMLCNDCSPLIKHNYEGFADKYADSIRREK